MACGMARSGGCRARSSRTLGVSSVLLLHAPACGFWPYSLSSAVHGKPPAAERPGAWLLSVALGTAACRAGAQRKAGFGKPLWVRGQLWAGEQPGSAAASRGQARSRGAAPRASGEGPPCPRLTLIF